MPESPPIVVPQRHPRPLRVAVAHDWLCGIRGGEHVLERVCALVEREFEPAVLLTMFSDGQNAGDTIDAWVSDGMLQCSWLNGIYRHCRGLRRWMLPLYPSAVAHLGRELARLHRQNPIDLLISTSSAAIKGLRPPPGVPHLCICFSPARYVWGKETQYGRDGTLRGALRALGLATLGRLFRRWDHRTAANVSRFAAISRHIQTRIKDSYQADSDLLYPPVRTELFTPDPTVPREDFWLCVGALEPYKRADLAIDAAIASGSKLKIVGTGSTLAVLRRRAAGHANIEFLGYVPDAQLRSLYRRARVLIFPQVEDFGIVALEAQACGLPVVARGEGGSLDTVIDGQTGALFSNAEPQAVIDAVARLPHDAAACRRQAERFSESRFDRSLLELMRQVVEEGRSASIP